MSINLYTISSILLDEIIEYIEKREEGIDGQWGSCREVDQLIKDQEMPDIYNQLIYIKTKINE